MNQRSSTSPTWLSGKINWFDTESGRGSILGSDGNMYRIHDFTLIDKGARIKANTHVEFTLQLSSKNPIVECVRPISKVQSKAKPKRRTRPDIEGIV